ncbi:MAG: DegV family protein [Candidatus Aquicultorales bacterium]
MRIGLVTDSTADMPDEFYSDNQIKVVPLYVRFGEEVFKDWVDMTPADFYPRMRQVTELPKTSQPSVEDFLNVYRSFEGYDGVVSIHLSSKLSGTIQSAEVAAADSPVPVTVIDGKQGSIATGILLAEAARARDAGADMDEIKQVVEDAIEDIRIAFCVDTLKYLEMGGRIGKAKFLAASLLKIRPVLTLVDGEVTPFKKVKSRAKVVEEMVAFVKDRSAGRPVRIGFVHAGCPEVADELRGAVLASGVKIESEVVSEMGCVIGTYLGPGSFALVTLPVRTAR